MVNLIQKKWGGSGGRRAQWEAEGFRCEISNEKDTYLSKGGVLVAHLRKGRFKTNNLINIICPYDLKKDMPNLTLNFMIFF